MDDIFNNKKLDDPLSVLSDDILCVILSFLNLRDAVKTRLISRRWRSLSPSLDVLQLDEFNMFGCKDARKRLGGREYQFRSIKVLDQFLQSFEPRSNDLKTVKLHFCFEGTGAFDIHGWVASLLRMKVETIDINLYFRDSLSPYTRKSYFPCHRFLPEKAANLRHLSLFSKNSSHLLEFGSQLRFLRSLVLIRVPLNERKLDSILSNCFNLEVLKLQCGTLPRTLIMHIKISCLKVLVIHNDRVTRVELHSPTLETFEFSGDGPVFSLPHVPLLKRVYLDLKCNLKLNAFARVPHLLVFSLLLLTKVKLVQNRSSVFSSLKQMDLKLGRNMDRWDWDPLISMDRLLVASPFLEILNLEMFFVDHCETRQEYSNRLYPHLKEVHIKGCHGWRSQMQLVAYLLRAATNLKRMVISVTEPSFLHGDPKPKVQEFLENETVNSTAEVIVI